jgi:hypothetical protein
MRVAPILLLTWSGLASAIGSVDAPNPELSLDWQATPNCSSEAQLRADVSRILHGAPSEARKVNARARAAQTADGNWHVELVTNIEGESHQRSFDAESCAAAENVLGLILAFAINPRAEPATSEAAGVSAASTTIDAAPAAPSSTPTPRAPTAALPSERAKVSSMTASPTAKSHHLLGVSAALASDLGTLPALTAGAELALGVYPGHFRFELSGADWIHRQGRASVSAAGATFSMVSAAARAGYTWPLGRLSLGPAVAAHFVQLRASGFKGSVASFDKTEVSGGFGVGGLLAWRVGEHVELHFSLEGLHWFNRPQFVVTEPNSAPAAPVYRPAALVAQAALAATVRFF